MPQNLMQMLVAIALATALLAAGAFWLYADGPGGGSARIGTLVTLALIVGAGMLTAGIAVQALLIRPLRRRLAELADLPAAGRMPALPLAGIEGFDEPLRRIAEHLDRKAEGGAGIDHGGAAQARLEAILRDLSEGVVVCNLEHQVLLYNRVALWLLGDGDNAALGLGRAVTGVLDESALLPALAELRGAGRATATRSLVLSRPDGARLDARLTLTRDDSGLAVGYVLTLAPKSDAPPPEDIPPRPEFYDFDLFDRPLDAAALDTPLAELAYVVFDCETTGLRPDAGDKLVSIGAVRVINGRLLRGETFSTLVDPGRPIPAAASRIHGIADEDVAGAPDAATALRRFHDYARGAVLVAHNAAFDMTLVTGESAGTGLAFDHPVLDTMLLSAVLQPHQMEHDLDSLVRRFGIELDAAERHTALGDARATAEVLVRHLALMEARGVATLREAVALERRSPHRGWRPGA